MNTVKSLGRHTATSTQSVKRRYFLMTALGALAAMSAHAATYYWKGPTDTDATAQRGAWSSLSNWSTEGVNGADAVAVPGASDKLYGLQTRAIDLEGQEWSIGGWDSTGDWTNYKMAIGNGTLNVVGDVTTHSDEIYLRSGAKLVFAQGTTFTPAVWDGGSHKQWVNADAELDILGRLNIYKYELVVHAGGTAVINPTKWDISNNTAQKSFLRTDGGTLNLPNGISFSSGSTGGGFGFSLELTEKAGGEKGTIILGGPVKKNGQPGTYSASFASGKIRATGDVSFDFDSVAVTSGASLELEVADGASFDFAGVAIGEGAVVTKTGSGEVRFTNGVIPQGLVVSEGAVVLDDNGASYDLSSLEFRSNGKVKIGAAGVTLTGWNSTLLSSGGFVSGVASPVAGSVLFTCANADVLALAKQGLDATLPEGFATTVDGNSLVVSSAYVFNSTTVTDINDPTGWAGGVVPVGKVVTIMGEGVAARATSLPGFAGITIQDGASLVIAGDATLPPITLSGNAALTIESGTSTSATAIQMLADGEARPAIAISQGAALEVPGGSVFPSCDLTVLGTLAATTAGDLVLGYASAGATSSFGLAVKGGTLSTQSGDIRFFCPAAGGTVTPVDVVNFNNATFAHDNDHGFYFCVNNPASVPVEFSFNNGTILNYPKRGYYDIAGGAKLGFVKDASLNRAHNQNEKFTLTVSGQACISLGSGTSSIIGESSSSGGSVGNGAMTFSPDTDGFTALVIDNATWETYHPAGNGKAVVEVYGDSTNMISQYNYNWAKPFTGFKAVHLNDNATLTIVNNVDATALEVNAPFTGTGSLAFSSPRSNVRTFNFTSAASTATGTLSADPAKKDALAIAANAKWAGTVAWNGKASITHSSTADSMIFGGIDLASDFTLRIWGDGTCDHYTLTGAGFANNGGKLVVAIGDGYEPQAEDKWTFARVPAGTPVPSPSGSTWKVAAAAVDGDDTVVDLVLSIAAGSGFEFNSDTITDLSDPDAWSSGTVPSGEDVKITGANTVAIIADAAAFPEFSSIAVRNGATLKVLADVTLPPLTLDSTAKLVIGDNAANVSAVLDATLATLCNASANPVALPVIEVATNATLTVASGMKFKNVDLRLYGKITKSADTDLAPVFGYAENGETSYIALTADGAEFDFHSNQVIEHGSVSIVFPDAGGIVIPVGTIVLRNSKRVVKSWADFGSWEFGRNNPTGIPFDVLLDGTSVDCSAYFYASGAAHLSLVNGACIRRNSSCLGHWFPMALQDAATITIGNGCYFDFTANDGQLGIDSQTAVDGVTVLEGGVYTVSYNSSGWVKSVFVADGGVLGVGKLYGTRARTDLLRGFGSARLDGDLFISSVNIGTGTADWDRHVKMSDIPFSGAGDVTVTNGVPAYPFTVTMVNGSNAASGAIKVDKVEGDAETALYFADGANWAGTVVAGNVGLAGESAAAVSFGRLDLSADFPVRVWKDGSTLSSDKVDVGEYVNNGGKLVPTMASDGAAFGLGDTFNLGKIKKTSPLPRMPASWLAKRVPLDDEYDTLQLKVGLGMQVILR